MVLGSCFIPRLGTLAEPFRVCVSIGLTSTAELASGVSGAFLEKPGRGAEEICCEMHARWPFELARLKKVRRVAQSEL